MTSAAATDNREATPAPADDVTIDVRDLRKWYPGKARPFAPPSPPFKAVDGVSFTIRRGEVLGLAGESGSGKSTTGALLLGLDQPTGGEIHFRGFGQVRPDTPGVRKAFTRAAQLVFQNPYEAFNPRYTIAESILEPLTIHFPHEPEERRARLARAMDRAGLTPHANYADRYPHELSGGQLQRVAIARAIALEPMFLVADEPVAMLDVSIRAGILNLLRRFADELGMSVLYISHDLATMRYICSRIAVMYRGRIVELGDAETVLDHPQHPYARALVAATPIVGPRGARTRPRTTDAQAALVRPAQGCAFRPRCADATAACDSIEPAMRAIGRYHDVACHNVLAAASPDLRQA